jgi:hypothetical protein
MPITELPNAEAIVSAHLRARTELDFLADRIYTALPKDVVFPAMRVTLIDDEKVTERPLWLVRSTLQVEAWGGSKGDAFRAANIAQGALELLVDEFTDDWVVTNVRFGAMRDEPDDSYTPARPRFLFLAIVTAHP